MNFLETNAHITCIHFDYLTALTTYNSLARSTSSSSIAGSIDHRCGIIRGYWPRCTLCPVCLLITHIFLCSTIYELTKQCELEIVTIFFIDVSFIRIAPRMVRSTYFVL
ncbi:hypothetical protein C364_07032 [Cryptococcus neoformans Bt63]|nr:hypothetical protein C364_07032 [Cryptococcus neoformans var. grubii Bt63]